MVVSPVWSGSSRLADCVPASGRAVDELWSPLSLPAGKLFGTDGIRGRAGDLLTAPLAFQVGYRAGQVLKTSEAGPMILGQDSRNSSDMLSAALSAGLASAGLEVWNLGLCPTPAVAYLANKLGAAGGVMISASHNPPEDNGIKFFSSQGAKLAPELQAQIEAALRSPLESAPALTNTGLCCDRPELLQDYVASLHQPFQPQVSLAGLKIVLDLAWGAAANLGERVFREMGAEVICLHDAPDGDRINVNCGSTHLASLKAAVLEHQADMGFAFDGDADRMMAVDSQGRVIDGDYVLYLWGNALRQAGQLPNDTLISTVMANLGFERAWEAQGGTLVRTAVGDQYVHAEMVKRGAKLGGEQSGHILCPHYAVSGDGMLTALHLAALVKQSGVSLADLRDQSFQTYPQLLRNVRVEDRDRRLNWHTCEPLQRAIAQAESDMGDRGRILVRASGTEPVIRVMVEAAHADLVDHWTTHLVSVVETHLAG
ncbi:phosphoglucosamine mutase [Thermoleptolyngbya sichuanensis XZ-Cy5]|uniref:phosphoglucosamine mutase n=1 Tax=Thermoleptolyngbya sichuanensis TaxID=2885951 RepID=UPI00240E7F0C|nr:phosphoglucosamine mutase [Thermoleptolyngbya sichuanensis]MDG2618012.1 phosphoglucosamine mutase [Thermoleptolyngbya sichuanensis XZ-Cy5]